MFLECMERVDIGGVEPVAAAIGRSGEDRWKRGGDAGLFGIKCVTPSLTNIQSSNPALTTSIYRINQNMYTPQQTH